MWATEPSETKMSTLNHRLATIPTLVAGTAGIMELHHSAVGSADVDM
jgi:hypothetical protein